MRILSGHCGVGGDAVQRCRDSAGNLKRTWVNNGQARDWAGSAGHGRDFLEAATEVKNIWVPYGE